jgi:hypothetical protein
LPTHNGKKDLKNQIPEESFVMTLPTPGTNRVKIIINFHAHSITMKSSILKFSTPGVKYAKIFKKGRH